MKPLYLLEKIAHPTDGHWQDPHRLQLQCAKLQQDYTPIRMDQDTPTKGGGSQPIWFYCANPHCNACTHNFHKGIKDDLHK
jgi:hypothetical protein